jgi:hypothetical protein
MGECSGSKEEFPATSGFLQRSVLPSSTVEQNCLHRHMHTQTHKLSPSTCHGTGLMPGPEYPGCYNLKCPQKVQVLKLSPQLGTTGR